MSASHLCFNCVPEGTPLGPMDLTAGPPRHCHGRYDTVRPGLIGGYRCSCECNQSKNAVRRRNLLLEYLDELDEKYGPPSPETVAEVEAEWDLDG